MNGEGGANNVYKKFDQLLRELAAGLVASLNSYFYSMTGVSFPEALVRSPSVAYNEAKEVVPESLLDSLLRLTLRRLGVTSPKVVEEIIRSLKSGDDGPFSSYITRAGS